MNTNNPKPKDKVKIAAALKYDQSSNEAPRLVAKAEGPLARTLEDIAEKSGISVEKNPALAESLVSLQIGAEIPENLYRSTAAVFALLWQADRKIKDH
jgi:flagellar biosynthesis protein